jgi:hypothetical protein
MVWGALLFAHAVRRFTLRSARSAASCSLDVMLRQMLLVVGSHALHTPILPLCAACARARMRTLMLHEAQQSAHAHPRKHTARPGADVGPPVPAQMWGGATICAASIRAMRSVREWLPHTRTPT